jgi:acyl homoserine lactone synthase
MHAIAISTPKNAFEAGLVHDHHKLRAEVFSGRLGWDVEVRDGTETYSFDELRPTYILAVGGCGKVVGCARLLPALGPTMVADVFQCLLPDGKLRSHATMVESSRFCVDTRLQEGRGAVHETTLTMFAGILEWSIANGLTEIVTVTDLRFERILSRVGWPLRRLSDPKLIGVTTAIAGTLPVDETIFLKLRPANYRSNIQSPLGQAA